MPLCPPVTKEKCHLFCYTRICLSHLYGPILEYACEVPNTCLHDQIESVQWSELNIFFQDTSYELARDKANLPTLSERRSFLCNCLFCRIPQSSHKLNCLFPNYKPTEYNLRKQILCSCPSTECRDTVTLTLQFPTISHKAF